MFGEKPKRRQFGGRLSDEDADFLEGLSGNNTRAMEICIAFRRIAAEAVGPLETEFNRYMKANNLTTLDRESQLRLLASTAIAELLKQQKPKK